jgi:dienelactone hydrolase
MGGSFALLAAEHDGIDAAIPLYGTPLAELAHVSCTSLLTFNLSSKFLHCTLSRS